MKLITTLIFTVFLTFANAEIINESENIIKDTKTNLLWQDNTAAKTEKMSFHKAVEYCKNLKVDNLEGWELPGFLELFSIVDPKVYNPTLSEKFKNFVNDNYWSGKKFGHGTSTEAIVINFKSGAFNRELMVDNFYVRCYQKVNN